MTKLLFLCTGNSCRSQMAEGLLRQLAGDRFEVFSAGVEPSRVHPLSIAAMAEIGIDISGQHSDDVRDYLDRGIDILISLSDYAARVCPPFPSGITKLHWSVKDPFQNWEADASLLDDYRQTRDELQQRIREFLQQKS
jgi:arsenate reductase